MENRVENKISEHNVMLLALIIPMMIILFYSIGTLMGGYEFGSFELIGDIVIIGFISFFCSIFVVGVYFSILEEEKSTK